MNKEGRFSPLNALLTAIIFTASLFLLMQSFGMVFETNDDFHISTIISQDIGSWCPYVSKLITVPLQMLDKITTVNVWTYLNLILIGISSACTVYVYCRNIETRSFFHLMLLYPICIGVFVVFVQKMNYTRTAFSVVAGAGAMLLYAVFGKTGSKERRVMYCLGLIGIPIAVLMREDPALLSVAFLGVITAAMLVVRLIKDHSPAGRKDCIRKSLLMLFPVALMGILVLVSYLILTPAEKEFIKFNDARTSVVDYKESYPDYDENIEYYESRGISREDYDIMCGWNFSDTEVLTAEKYQKFAELKTTTPISFAKIYAFVSYMFVSGEYLPTFALIAFFFFLCDPKNSSVFMIVSGLALVAVIGYLRYLGRIPPRIYIPATYTAVILAIFGSMVLKNPPALQASEKRVNLLLFFTCLYFFISATPIPKHITPETEIYKAHRSAYAYMGQQKDKTFAIYETAIRKDYRFDPWQRGNIDNYDNVLNLNGWLCRLPHWQQKLEHLGIANPTRALFERDDIYATFEKNVYRFIQNNYGEDITASEVFRLPADFDWMDEHFVRYTKPRESVKAADAEHLSISHYVPNSFNFREVRLQGKVSSVEDDLMLYCVLNCNGEKKTYALNCEPDGSFGAILYDIPEDAVINKDVFEFFWA